MKPLLVLGCGGHGRVVADVAADCGYDRIAFLDDGHASGSIVGGCPVLGKISTMGDLSSEWPAAIVAIGNNAVRLALFAQLFRSGVDMPRLIHPSAVISRGAELSPGVFVAPGAVINTGARIGEAAIVNTGARIDHDCRIGAGSHIAPGATLSGAVKVGLRAWLGTGCSVRQNVAIGDDAVVGVGAAVVRDLSGPGVYIGVPARLLTKHSSGYQQC